MGDGGFREVSLVGEHGHCMLLKKLMGNFFSSEALHPGPGSELSLSHTLHTLGPFGNHEAEEISSFIT